MLKPGILVLHQKLKPPILDIAMIFPLLSFCVAFPCLLILALLELLILIRPLPSISFLYICTNF